MHVHTQVRTAVGFVLWWTLERASWMDYALTQPMRHMREGVRAAPCTSAVQAVDTNGCSGPFPPSADPFSPRHLGAMPTGDSCATEPTSKFSVSTPSGGRRPSVHSVSFRLAWPSKKKRSALWRNYPQCADKMVWMAQHWKEDPVYKQKGVDGSNCSFQA